jgi:hypothetical protein
METLRCWVLLGPICFSLVAACGEPPPAECTGADCPVACAAPGDCAEGLVCDPAVGRCVAVPADCGPLNETGACPDGHVCQAGACVATGCTDRLEPNDAPAMARAAPDGDTGGLQICDGDEDHLKLAVPPGQMGTVGVRFDHPAGDLDLSAYRDGACLGGRIMHECDWSYRSFESGEEYLSVWNGGAAPRTFTWKLLGRRGATNSYTLSTGMRPFSDGLDCAGGYGQPECEGRPDGPGGKTQLVQFPFADPSDPYLGDGYRFDSGSNYRWLRRELVMLIRYALHETRLKFADTKALGLIDMCQRDGITPGYDIGKPRHPKSTHDQGGNADIAYYTTLAARGAIEYNEARIVCDAAEGSNDGSYCDAGAAQTHVVDLPRQVYFMAKLYDHPRVRVIGADQVIGPLLEKEAERQYQAGMITRAERSGFDGKLAYGDGWPFHHHHIHVSMNWWARPASVLPGDADRDPPDGCGLDLARLRAR